MADVLRGSLSNFLRMSVIGMVGGMVVWWGVWWYGGEYGGLFDGVVDRVCREWMEGCWVA